MGKRLLGRNRTSEQGTWYNTLIAVGIAAIRCLGPPGRSSKRKSRSTATIPIRRVAVVIPAIVRIVIAGQGPKILHSSASAFAFSAVASRTCHSQYQSIPNQKSLLWRPYCSTTTPPPPPPPPTTIQSSTMMKGTNNNGDDDDAIPTLLQRLSPAEVTLEIKDPVNPRALQQATAILHELSQGTEGTVDPSTLLQVAQRLGDVTQDRCTVPADLVVSKAACADAYDNLHVTERTALTNMYTRIKAFAALQRASVVDTDMAIPGGKAGQTVSPCQGTCRGISRCWYRRSGLEVLREGTANKYRTQILYIYRYILYRILPCTFFSRPFFVLINLLCCVRYDDRPPSRLHRYI